jgi:trimethylamine--corrinoid protein Co-methyltransferase
VPRKGFTRQLQALEFLSQAQLEAMHRATLDILWETGIRFESDWALDFLNKNGCRVEAEHKRVRFPGALVQECLAQVPKQFRVKAPDPQNELVYGGNTVYFSHSSGMQTIDLDTYQPRLPTRSEYIDCIRVLDALPALDHLGCYPYFGYEGISPAMGIPEGVALHMQYSGKHQLACCSNDCELFTIQMAQAVGHELTGTIGSSPPLAWGKDAITAARRVVEAGFPLATVDGCIMGGNGPVTAPGSVLVSNAEQLAMVVLVQILRPGQRMLIGHFSLSMNMRTGSPNFGGIESSINNVIFNQLWRYYGVPFSNGSPGYVNAKTIDYQAGYEKSMAALISALSGANHILLHLGVAGELSAHPVQAILDDDIAGIIGRFIQGEELSDETIALDLIKVVGPLPGNYLSTIHTRDWWRKEQYVPQSADRSTYTEWAQTGKKRALDYARHRMDKILAVPQTIHLTPGQERDIDKILQEAREFYAKREQV